MPFIVDLNSVAAAGSAGIAAGQNEGAWKTQQVAMQLHQMQQQAQQQQFENEFRVHQAQQAAQQQQYENQYRQQQLQTLQESQKQQDAYKNLVLQGQNTRAADANQTRLTVADQNSQVKYDQMDQQDAQWQAKFKAVNDYNDKRLQQIDDLAQQRLAAGQDKATVQAQQFASRQAVEANRQSAMSAQRAAQAADQANRFNAGATNRQVTDQRIAYQKELEQLNSVPPNSLTPTQQQRRQTLFDELQKPVGAPVTVTPTTPVAPAAAAPMATGGAAASVKTTQATPQDLQKIVPNMVISNGMINAGGIEAGVQRLKEQGFTTAPNGQSLDQVAADMKKLQLVHAKVFSPGSGGLSRDDLLTLIKAYGSAQEAYNKVLKPNGLDANGRPTTVQQVFQ